MKYSNYLKGVQFSCFIHTLEIVVKKGLVPDEVLEHKPYISKRTLTRSKLTHIVLNPNKYHGNELILSFHQFIVVLTAIIEEIGLADHEWMFSRIDLAIHTTSDYDQLYKLSCYIKELFASEIRCKNSYRFIGDDLKKRSTKVQNDGNELEIYNKHLECGMTDLPQTRVEIRRKRLDRRKQKSPEHFTKTIMCEIIESINKLKLNITALDKIKCPVLTEGFQVESSIGREGRTKQLKDFVTKYADFIFTRISLYYLFCQIEEKNSIENFNSWLFYYRKSGVITMITEKEVKTYCDKLINAIRIYLKN